MEALHIAAICSFCNASKLVATTLGAQVTPPPGWKVLARPGKADVAACTNPHCHAELKKLPA